MAMLNVMQLVTVVEEFKVFCPNRANMEDALIQVQTRLVQDELRRKISQAMDVAWEDEFPVRPVVKRKVE